MFAVREQRTVVLRFYELLVLIDAIRLGRAREREIAAKLLNDRLENARYRTSKTS